MYVSGMPPDEIAKTLSLPGSETITNWAKREGWQEERTVQLEVITDDLMKSLLANNKRILDDLATIRTTAIESIEDGSVVPAKYSEAANAYISATDAERKIKDEMVLTIVLNDIAQAILEEVTDKDILFRLGEKLRKIFSKYQNK